ncbi:MAG: PulJ/GspJ family protein [Acidimicrobiales bacterium]
MTHIRPSNDRGRWTTIRDRPGEPTDHPRHACRDAGVTLVELMVAMSVFLILITITIPVLNTFFSVDTGVTNTVAAVNQLLPATTTLERYLRSAVQPAPADVVTPGLPGIPVPMFVPTSPATSPTTYQMGTNSLAFYSNVGNQAGPEMVQAATAGPDAKGLYTLTITATQPDPGKCPGTGAQMTSSSTSTCTYTSQPAKPIAVIPDVVNGSPTDPNPIFQYSIATGPGGIPAFVTPSPAWTCTSASACDPATLTAMQITIATQPNQGSPTSIKTVVYFVAPGYSANVG